MALEGTITRRAAKRLAIAYETVCNAVALSEWDRVPDLARRLIAEQEATGIELMSPALLSRLAISAERLNEMDATT